VEILQAIIQAILQGLGPGDYCLKVLKGVLLAGRFVPGRWFLVPGYCACYLRGVLFLVLWCCARCLRGVLFLGVAITGTGSLGSPRKLTPGVLAPGHCGYVGALDSLLLASLFLGIAGTGSLGSPRQSRQLSTATRPPTASPCSRVVARCFKGVSWEGLSGRVYTGG